MWINGQKFEVIPLHEWTSPSLRFDHCDWVWGKTACVYPAQQTYNTEYINFTIINEEINANGALAEVVIMVKGLKWVPFNIYVSSLYPIPTYNLL